MSVLKTFFKDTIIYGLATVLPRLMNIFMVRFHTDILPPQSYSDTTTFYVYAAFFNVLLTYGMETAFFRFFSKSEDKQSVFTTALISLITSASIALLLVVVFNTSLANGFGLTPLHFNILIGLLLLDTIVVIPFAYLRATGKPLKFTLIKISNVLIYVFLNIFFLWAVPKYNIELLWFKNEPLISYIFIANFIASASTLLLLLPYFFKFKLVFKTAIFKQLFAYGWPIMIAGLAYVINENFDKWYLPQALDKNINGAYSGCYKIGVFMTIFILAFRLGAEPFFFNHAKEKNATRTYATIMKYFVILGASMYLVIISYLDILKTFIVNNESYWVAIKIVPIILLANLCLGIYFNLAIWYKLTDKTRYGMYLSIFGALVTIIANVVLVPKFGFIASAWATLLAYGLMMGVSYYLGQKQYPVPYNTKRIGLYLILAIVLSYGALQTNSNYIINTVLVFLFLTLVFLLEKNELKQLLKIKSIENKDH